MAQSGYTPIQLYSSPTPGATPAASNLTDGELAINGADGKLFFKNTAGNTQVIADSAWSSFSQGIKGIQGSGTSVATAGTVQFANSNGVTFGLNGSTITASVAAAVNSYNIISAGGNTAGVLTTFGSSTVVLAGGSGITLSQNSNTISINAGGGNVTFSGGTTSIATNSIVFGSAGGAVSFGMTSNTVTAIPYLTSFDLGAAFAGFGAYFDSGTLVVNRTFTSTNFSYRNIISPFILTQPLVFQKIDQSAAFIYCNQNSFIVPQFGFATSAGLSTYAGTYSWQLLNHIYTKNVDTFSQHLSLQFPIVQQESYSFARTSGVNTNTFSGTFSATLSFPTGTTSSGFLWTSTTATATGSATLPVSQSQLNAGNIGWNMSIDNNFASLLTTGQDQLFNFFPMSSAPITLAPNTYWFMQGIYFSASLGSAVTYGSGNRIAESQSLGYRIATVPFTNRGALMNARRAPNLGRSAVEYSDFNPFFGYAYSTTTAGPVTTTYIQLTGHSFYDVGFSSSFLSTLPRITTGNTNIGSFAVPFGTMR